MKLNSMVQISLLLFSSIWIISSCGVSPGPYIPVAGGPVPAATSEPSGTTGTAPGTKPATTGTKPATGTTPGAKPAVTPPATTATPAAPPSAALVQQGTTVFNAKCAACHGAIAQKANDPRINLKTAAQLSAAQTSKPLPHQAVVWPVATEITALEAALK